MATTDDSKLSLTGHDYNEKPNIPSYQTLDHDPSVKRHTKYSASNGHNMTNGEASVPSAYTNSSEDGEEGDEEVFETREVQVEGDVTKVTYTHKVSVHGNKKKKDNRHCHSNAPKTTQDKKSRNKLIIASILCMIFMIIEIVGGILAGSLAIISDAAHLLTDFASFMISLVAIYLASRPATQRFNYGWHRAEILGAFASIIMLWILTGVLAYEAVKRVITPDYEIDSKIMLITAGIGVGFNIILGTTLHQHGHSHGGHGHSHGGHGHSHGGSSKSHDKSKGRSSNKKSSSSTSNKDDQFQLQVSQNYGSFDSKDKQTEVTIEHGHSHSHSHQKEKNINVKAAFIHVIGDLLQSVGVLVAALLIYFKPEWKMADPICTFVFSFIVVVTTVTIMRDIIVVLMEGKPRSISFSDVRQTLLSVDKVKDTHNLRMWSLTMDKVALSVHLVVDDEVDAHEVLRNASTALRSQFNILDITIQIEEYVNDMDDCNSCVDPS